MKKISIVIADEDGFYLKQMTGYLVKSTQYSFEVYSFSRQESLSRFLEEGSQRADILLLSENMRCAAADRCQADAKVLLTDGGCQAPEGYELVQKYQKTAGLIGEVMLIYGKHSGKADGLAQGGKKTQFIGVYSPVGGSGKTTIALLLAKALGARKKKVFYQNCERIDSTRGLLPAEARISLSDLLVAVHSEEPGVGLSILSKMYTAPDMGFSYVNPPDSSLEFNEVALDEQLALLGELGRIGQFDYVILDFESELNSDKLRLLELCDRIVMPFLPDMLSLNKLAQFVRETGLREELADLSGKLIFAANRVGPGMEGYLRQQSILQTCVPAAMLPLSEQLANPGTILRGGPDGTACLSAVADRLCG